jgi:hypothetical protein
MTTRFLTLPLLLSTTFATACMTDDLAKGEEAWTFELKVVEADAPRTLPACSKVERGFELHVLHGDAGELLAIYSESVNQRFDRYVLANDQGGVTTLDMMRDLPGGVAERWRFELYARTQPGSYVGAATQQLVAFDGISSCQTIYLTSLNVVGN